ncbi:STAG domain-containing protein [Heterostelium album PN500]|uniref:STAG domain-containing protein n=1 Tax=Heterostelium pallidum (strain ATCC 26659 / Pp 5 / PN500) TaxID=670386 RepID=D3AWP1_HETP5|nr:STAG domain-containing protein [Heterostelium album PN500]EFA86714.1 STAG domain-containing protein [Heterostelium album PN500]|eukprot:XP_020438818.1 STAG domain-containing protein [Heterostelium album PN500]
MVSKRKVTSKKSNNNNNNSNNNNSGSQTKSSQSRRRSQSLFINVKTLVTEWVDRYNEDPENATFEVINLIVECGGADAMTVKDFQSDLEDGSKEVCETDDTKAFPLSSKRSKSLINNYQYPSTMLTSAYLSQIGWGLNDWVAEVRQSAVKGVIQLYSNENLITQYDDFTEKFRFRIVDIAAGDKVDKIAIDAIELVSIMCQHSLIEQVLLDKVLANYMVDNEAIVKATGKLLYQILLDPLESKLNALPKAERRSAKNDIREQQLMKLLEFLEEKSKATNVPYYLVFALWEKGQAIFTDWSFFVKFLSELEEKKLSENQLLIILRMISASVKIFSGDKPPIFSSERQQLFNEDPYQQNEYTKDSDVTTNFISIIPALLSQHKANFEISICLVEICKYFNLETYITLRLQTKYSELLNLLSMILLENPNEKLVETIADTLHDLSQGLPSQLEAPFNLTIMEIFNQLGDSLRTISAPSESSGTDAEASGGDQANQLFNAFTLLQKIHFSPKELANFLNIFLEKTILNIYSLNVPLSRKLLELNLRILLENENDIVMEDIKNQLEQQEEEEEEKPKKSKKSKRGRKKKVATSDESGNEDEDEEDEEEEEDEETGKSKRSESETEKSESEQQSKKTSFDISNDTTTIDQDTQNRIEQLIISSLQAIHCNIIGSANVGAVIKQVALSPGARSIATVKQELYQVCLSTDDEELRENLFSRLKELLNWLSAEFIKKDSLGLVFESGIEYFFGKDKENPENPEFLRCISYLIPKLTHEQAVEIIKNKPEYNEEDPLFESLNNVYSMVEMIANKSVKNKFKKVTRGKKQDLMDESDQISEDIEDISQDEEEPSEANEEIDDEFEPSQEVKTTPKKRTKTII